MADLIRDALKERYRDNPNWSFVVVERRYPYPQWGIDAVWVSNSRLPNTVMNMMNISCMEFIKGFTAGYDTGFMYGEGFEDLD